VQVSSLTSGVDAPLGREADLCGCPAQAYAGVVVVDTLSEPGSWTQHLRDTACMRTDAATARPVDEIARFHAAGDD
jgi:hypothetical protein